MLVVPDKDYEYAKPVTWVDDYLYMEEVFTKQYYLHQYNSFTDWLINYAKQRGSSKATLWHRLKAGRYYQAYYQRSIQKCYLVSNLEEIQINPDCLNMIERIAGDDVEVGDKLIRDLLRKKITLKDSKLMWSNVKLQREKNNEKVGKANSYDKGPVKYYDASKEIKVINCLRDSGWLRESNVNAIKGKYRLINAFNFGGNDIAPLDALIVQTGKDEIVLHAVDIINSNSHNFDSYARINMLRGAIDYFWVVADAENIDELKKSLKAQCGILVYNSKEAKIDVVREAIKQTLEATSAIRLAIFEEIIKNSI